MNFKKNVINVITFFCFFLIIINHELIIKFFEVYPSRINVCTYASRVNPLHPIFRQFYLLVCLHATMRLIGTITFHTEISIDTFNVIQLRYPTAKNLLKRLHRIITHCCLLQTFRFYKISFV